jgi:hypothetical protein
MGRRRRKARVEKPKLTLLQILVWADNHFHRTGEWPKTSTGPVKDNLNETWGNIDVALRRGLRGLSGGSSLARLLDEQRGVRNVKNLPPLTEAQILTWADEHHRVTGEWPVIESGPIPGPTVRYGGTWTWPSGTEPGNSPVVRPWPTFWKGAVVYGIG